MVPSELVWEILEQMHADIAEELAVLLSEPGHGGYSPLERRHRITEMQEVASGEGQRDEERMWMIPKPGGGWAVVPWDELGAVQKSKLRIFAAVARAGGKLAAGGGHGRSRTSGRIEVSDTLVGQSGEVVTTPRSGPPVDRGPGE